MTRERALILVALLAILGAVAWSARPHDATAAERVDRITSELRCVTCQGLSVKDSPASIDASSITQAPSSGDECLPLPSLIVW